MAFSRFNFGDYEPTYPSEEARICDYLTEVNNLIPKELYWKIFDALVKNDKKQLADILTNLCKLIKGRNEETKPRKTEIDSYKKQIEEKNKQITELQDELKIMSACGKGWDIDILKDMKSMYEEGYSLTEIGRVFNRDKATVKRKLIQMGVQIR